jgi:hypothetical protein
VIDDHVYTASDASNALVQANGFFSSFSVTMLLEVSPFRHAFAHLRNSSDPSPLSTSPIHHTQAEHPHPPNQCVGNTCLPSAAAPLPHPQADLCEAAVVFKGLFAWGLVGKYFAGNQMRTFAEELGYELNTELDILSFGLDAGADRASLAEALTEQIRLNNQEDAEEDSDSNSDDEDFGLMK